MCNEYDNFHCRLLSVLFFSLSLEGDTKLPGGGSSGAPERGDQQVPPAGYLHPGDGLRDRPDAAHVIPRPAIA